MSNNRKLLLLALVAISLVGAISMARAHSADASVWLWPVSPLSPAQFFPYIAAGPQLTVTPEAASTTSLNGILHELK